MPESVHGRFAREKTRAALTMLAAPTVTVRTATGWRVAQPRHARLRPRRAMGPRAPPLE